MKILFNKKIYVLWMVFTLLSQIQLNAMAQNFYTGWNTKYAIVGAAAAVTAACGYYFYTKVKTFLNNGRTPLINVVIERDEQKVKTLVEQEKVAINETQITLIPDEKKQFFDRTGRTALMWAVGTNQDTMVKYLIEHNANIDVQDVDGFNPLMVTAIMGLDHITETLLEKKANFKLKAPQGLTAFIFAACFGKKNIVQQLLNARANLEEAMDNGITPLMQASISGHAHVTRLLLEKGADINAQDNTGKTALAHAIEGKKQNVINVLHDYKKFMDMRRLADNPDMNAQIESWQQGRYLQLDAPREEEEKENMSIHSSSSSTINTEEVD